MTPQEKKAYNKNYYETHKDYWQKYKTGRGDPQKESWYKNRYDKQGREMQSLYQQAQTNRKNADEYRKKAEEIRRIMDETKGKSDWRSRNKRNKLLKELGVDPEMEKPYRVASRYERQAKNLDTTADKFNERANKIKKNMKMVEGDIVRARRQYQVANYPRSAYIRPESLGTKVKRAVKRNTVDRGKNFIDSWLVGGGRSFIKNWKTGMGIK